MLRVLRAFGWLRWRVLLNSLERHGGRDRLERLSLALEQLMPAIVLLLMVPSALTLAGIAAYAGLLLAHGEPRVMAFELLRFVLFGGCVFALVGPLVLPAGDRTNAVRFLLLPISRQVLYLAQAVSALADPWALLVTAVLVALPVGLAAGGAVAGAVVAATAGATFLALLAGLTLAMTSLVQITVRDRRRGEVIALVFFLVLPMIGLLPSLLAEERDRNGRRRREPPAAWTAVERTVMAVVPSELYVNAVRAAARSEADVRRVAILAAAAVALHGIAFIAFNRVLSSPATSGASGSRTRWGQKLPLVSSGTSAVALAQLKLGLRTPRGRSTMLSPIALFVVFSAVMYRSESGARLGFIAFETGVGLAAFTAFVALMSIVPIAMNQFASDRAGLTLALLGPIETRALLRGKALGNALIAGGPAALCIVGALILFPCGEPALWLCVPLSLAATYLLVAPAAAALSAIFPRAVDMNSIGRSNAHGTAGFLGTLAFLAAGAPCLILVTLATAWLERPLLAPVFLVVWLGISAAAGAMLLDAAGPLFERRRENLAMVG
jgi:hypothetical protein